MKWRKSRARKKRQIIRSRTGHNRLKARDANSVKILREKQEEEEEESENKSQGEMEGKQSTKQKRFLAPPPAHSLTHSLTGPAAAAAAAIAASIPAAAAAAAAGKPDLTAHGDSEWLGLVTSGQARLRLSSSSG
jgi:cytochrome c1